MTVGHWTDDRAGRRRVLVGLLAEKGVPSRMAEALDRELPQILNDRLSSEVVWEVDHQSETLPLDKHGEIPLIEVAQKKGALGWDIAIVLTDLPRRYGTQPIVSDYSAELGVGLLSMPALGAWQVRRRSRALVVHLAGHLLEGTVNLDESCIHLGRHFRHVRHISSAAEHVDEHLGLVGVRGRSRLLSGMVIDNRPWRLVPHLAGATAAAAATAAYGVFTVTFWKMADALPSWRLGLISAVSIAAMATWLLLYNRLWEKPSRPSDREKALLYNLSTLITLTSGVACMYAILYLVALVASFAVIDSGYLSSQLGHTSDPMNYTKIVWLASSVGIVAGALGSSFESEEAVRQATYSKRERERQRETQPSHGGEHDRGTGN